MITHRIKSEEGASLMIALLFFLLCAMAGSVILAAATAASGRTAGIQTQDENYYSVSSAEELVKSELTDQKYTVYQWYDETGSNKIGQTSFYAAKPDGNLAVLLQNAADSIYKGGTSYTDLLTVTPADTTYLKTVKAEFTMSSDYSVLVRFYQASGEAAMTLKLSAAVYNDETQNDLILQDTTQQLASDVTLVAGTRYQRKTVSVIWTDPVVTRD